jgi:hypothetical protein
MAAALLLTALALTPVSAGTGAEVKGAAPAKGRKLSPSRAASVAAADELKLKLIAQRDAMILEAAPLLAEVKKHEELFPKGLTSRKALEDAKAAADAAQRKIDEVSRDVDSTDHLIAELLAPEPTAPSRNGLYLRGTGVGRWSIANAVAVDTYFRSRFGRPMPVSAFGQSAVHNRLRYDHSNAVDVPVHPDSSEGQAILGYLRAQGIPFLAFRGAVPGVSTGAHIHIGRPSSRY